MNAIRLSLAGLAVVGMIGVVLLFQRMLQTHDRGLLWAIVGLALVNTVLLIAAFWRSDRKQADYQRRRIQQAKSRRRNALASRLEQIAE